MDVSYINAFTEIILSTFETSCNKKPFRYKDFKRIDGAVTNKHELMCIIEFSGELTGSLVMNFPAETANHIYGGMMMEEINEFNEEVAEGFSEILNMVIGNVKATITDKKMEFEAPSTKIGAGDVYDKNKDLPWLLIPMAFHDWGKFDLYICIKE